MSDEEVSSSKLREMLKAIKLDKQKKRSERIRVYNQLNDRFNAWVDANCEMALEVTQQDHSGVEVEVVQFDDGQWTYGLSVNLSDRGYSSGINPHGSLYGSREDAVIAGAAKVAEYLLQQVSRNDIRDGLMVQLRKFIKASVSVVLGQRTKTQGSLF